MVWLLFVGKVFATIGFTVTPILLATGEAEGAFIAGIFSVINVVLTAILNRKVLQEARENRREIRGARQASRESIEELKDVKRKVSGDRRSTPNSPRAAGKRSSDTPGEPPQ